MGWGVGWSRAGETAKVGGSQSKMSSSAWWGREAASCLQLSAAQQRMAGAHPAGLRAAPVQLPFSVH